MKRGAQNEQFSSNNYLVAIHHPLSFQKTAIPIQQVLLSENQSERQSDTKFQDNDIGSSWRNIHYSV